MATSSSYGRQFELMMTEISADLVKGLFKERGIEFEESDMDFIRGFFNTPTVSVSVSVEKVPDADVTKKKAKGPKGKGGKGIVRAPDQDQEELEPAVVAPKTKAKGATKPKCQATTAKGTPCSKCASEGEVFCSVHLASSSSSKSSKKKSGGEKEATATKKKKPTVSAPAPKHTHGLTSPVPDTGCDLCETHGMPFEIPEYEEEEDPELGGDDEKHDPTYALEEEDFDEIDD